MNAKNATVHDTFPAAVVHAGLVQVLAWDAAVTGGRDREVPGRLEVADALARGVLFDEYAGKIESRPVRDLLWSAGDPGAQLSLIAAVGLHALSRDGLAGRGGARAAGDVRSLLTMHQATTLGPARRVDFGGDDAITGHAIEVGNTHSPQPFHISVAKPGQSEAASPASPPAAPADDDLQSALRWAFATTLLGVEGLTTATVHFKSIIARGFDSTESWHQQFHPRAVIVALLLYLCGFGGQSGDPVARRYLDIACWTFGGKLHGQVALKRLDIVALQYGGEPSNAAILRLEELLREVVGEGSPHGLIIWIRRWLLCDTHGGGYGTAPATHGLGVSITAVHREMRRGLFVWPRICNTARHFGGAFKPLNRVRCCACHVHRVHSQAKAPPTILPARPTR